MAKKQKTKLFRVFWETPTNLGFDKVAIKLFKTRAGANRYAKTLLKEAKAERESVEEDTAIVIEDVHTGERVKQWIFREDEIDEY